MPTTQNEHEFQLALRHFRHNWVAMLCLGVLVVLYAAALFADFLSPYSYKNEDRRYSYSPPTKIHFFQEGKLRRPFVYHIKFHYDEHRRRIYEEDRSRIFPIRFFIQGDTYKILGLIPSNRHLWGVENEGRIYLLGADARGRDILSRLLYGARVSLSIGLIGVTISFSIGLLIGGISGYYGGRIDNILMRLA